MPRTKPRPTKKSRPAAADEPAAVDPVAVIDVGASAIRMAVAEVRRGGAIRELEHLAQSVNLGKDVFGGGAISQQTIEQCVRVLRDYRSVLAEYRLLPDSKGHARRRRRVSPDRLRVVATSAVREATNRLTFLDRVFAATGIEVETIDEAEANRITYLGILPQLTADVRLREARCVVVEVGGGSTELLVVRRGDVQLSQSYRLGALRLRELLGGTAPGTARQIMERQIDRTVGQIAAGLPETADADTATGDDPGEVRLVALGADVRFAAKELRPDAEPDAPIALPAAELAAFTDRMFAKSEDELAARHHLTFPDAETLRPALLTYVRLLGALGLDELVVSGVNLRDGLLMDLAAGGAWAEQAARQAISSALELGKRYAVDLPHAEHVAHLAGRLFDELLREHRLPARYRRVLVLAGLLHETGLYIGTTGYHKHSMYLIVNSDLFGVSRRDLNLVGLVARYHRRASPKSTHTLFNSVRREDRVAVSVLAALLRVAIALDDSRTGRVRDVETGVAGDRLILTAAGSDDVSLERLALGQSGTLFREIFGKQVLLRGGRR